MSETTIQNDTTTTNVCGGRYSRLAAPQAPPQPVSQTPTPQPPDQPPPGYVRAYRAANKSVVVFYNSAEAHARAVRRQISRLLAD
jgi:hypothetical protein